jgi:hypothetical protein
MKLELSDAEFQQVLYALGLTSDSYAEQSEAAHREGDAEDAAACDAAASKYLALHNELAKRAGWS